MSQHNTDNQGKPSRRQHRLVISCNDEELSIIEQYCKNYRLRGQSRSRILRHLILKQMIQQYEQDSPLLFSEDEMR